MLAKSKLDPNNRHRTSIMLVCFFALGACGLEASTASENAPQAQTQIQEETKIFNYIAYSETFASSGQPSKSQLALSHKDGVEQIVYLAFSDQEKSLPAEDRLVKDLGMNYLQIPVDWKAPQHREYSLFAQAMQIEPNRKTLLHCQANFRASAFAMLYRVLELDVPLPKAKADMNSIWIPNSTWTNFILNVLRENEVDPNCEGCDWTPSTIGD